MILVLAALVLAAEQPADAERAAWRYRRRVSLERSEPLVSLVLPPELSAKAAPSGRDLRLVDDNGREVAYLLDWTSEREGLATWRAGIKDVRREQEQAQSNSAVRSQWTLDLGLPRTFTDLALHLPEVAFAWHVRVEASLDGKQFETVAADAALFDQTWNHERVRKTEIRFDAPLSARYLRITARSASDSATLEIDGASITLRRRFKGDAWSMNVAAVPEAEPRLEGRVSRYRLDASSLLPFDEIEIVSDDPAFSRRVRLVEEAESAGRKTQTRLGEGPVFRLRANDAVIAGEALRVPVRGGSGGRLYLEIDDGGSPALRGLKVRLHGSRVRLLFPAPGGGITLYYGNEGTRAPTYDLEGLRPRMSQALATSPATLDSEEPNPLFKREPPLRFAATLGASLDPSKWRRERVLSPILEEDVYSLTLRASNLASLRSDLGDLRIVNDENRQVPFLIEPDFADERISLVVQKETGAPQRSLYRLVPPGPVSGNEDRQPRVTRIELDAKDAFFERPARFLHSRNASRREQPFSLTLARKPPSTGLLILGVSAPLGTMTLEVDDGDNAPLDLGSAWAVVRVPRMVFKAAPGQLRLLLDNAEAVPPRYDIAGLRSELLAYSALAAHAGTLADNQGSAPSMFSRLTTVPGSTLVWSAIIVAIIALVGLTLRTLKGA